MEKGLMVAALFGRMLCHAFKNMELETYVDAIAINQLFTGCSGTPQINYESFMPATNKINDTLIIPVAKFAHPDEKISPHECKSRVRNTAQAMRTIISCISHPSVTYIVNGTIDRLEDVAFHCCNNDLEWTRCLEPIIDAWHMLQDTWDNLVDMFTRGIDIDFFLKKTKPAR